MFAYCANDPINCVDSSGLFWAELWSGFKSVVRTAIHIGAGVIKAFGVDTAGIGAYWLNMSKDSNGIYHANFDCWQWLAGYNDFYDFMFDIGTYMIPYKDSFKYNDVVYAIWAWKGDYINLGAGAELGIYVGEGPHLFVDKSVAMPMQMWLNDKYGTNLITYKDGGKQWWCTGFNENFHVYNANSLTAIFSIRFLNTGMYSAFVSANLSGNWIYFNSSQTAVLIF